MVLSSGSVRGRFVLSRAPHGDNGARRWRAVLKNNQNLFSLHKQFGFGGKVVVDDVVQQGNINATCRDVCDDQKLALVGSKFSDVGFPCCPIQITIYDSNCVTRFAQEVPQKFNVVLRRCKNDCLLT